MKNSFSNLADLANAFGRDINDVDKHHKSRDDSLVYSTDGGRIKAKNPKQSITASDGFAKVRRETKGRKGKGVVTITGLALDSNSLKNLAKKLKKTCGTGGTVIAEVIEIQGDKRDIIKTLLEQEGFKVKFIGG